MTRLIASTVLLVGVTCLVAVTMTTQLVAATNTLIMSGLNNPRGLALGPDGGIYVAEAGTGGAGPCQIGSTGKSPLRSDRPIRDSQRRSATRRHRTCLPRAGRRRQ
jgi:hypothetical protein